ncbi:MAG: 3-methyl-2-oxobutanoate hydroxymethyltransferase, partial [Firmicutes bacterium]|nr:3-methyl-2-oxobutanoate hydroxymethyltransferase [Bacillota bacterium]
MAKLTIPDMIRLKGHRPISWMTAYDFVQGQLVAAAGIDVILVGDSLGMTTLGFNTTLPVTIEHMVHHSAAVRRGAPDALMIVDLPFLTYTEPGQTLRNAGRVMQETLADGVKLEGGQAILPVVDALIKESIPVIGHL